ncbi:MAG: hypothetical protein ACYDHP_10645 [Ferrimicrobium sp.]
MGVGVVGVLLTMPSLVQVFAPTTDPLDISWIWYMGYALEHHLQWGRQVIFTYGPLGFLDQSYFYSYHLAWAIAATVTIVGRVLFVCVYVGIMYSLTRARSYSRYVILLGGILYALLATQLSFAGQASILGALLLVVAVTVEDERSFLGLVGSSGLLLSLAALIKGSLLLLGFALLVVFPIALLFLASRRRVGLAFIGLGAFAVGFVLMWSVAGQSVFNIPAYFTTELQIITGYTPAMSISGNHLQTIAAILSVGILGLIGLYVVVRRKRTIVAQLLIVGVVVFEEWKEGFTRHDPGLNSGHAILFFAAATALIPVVVVLVAPVASLGPVGALASAFILVFAFLIPALQFQGSIVGENYRSYWDLMTSVSARVNLQHAVNVAIRQQFALTPAMIHQLRRGTMSTPLYLVLAQGYHFQLDASPVLQEYSVYTANLDRLNASQLLGRNAPRMLLYTYGSIDGRYPLYDEPAMFKAMFECYRAVGVSPSGVFLVHRACQRFKPTRPWSAELHLGRWLKIPAGVDFLDLRVGVTGLGKLLDLVYKPGEIFVSIRLSGGQVAGPFRLVYGVAGNGLYVGHFIAGDQQLYDLLHGQVGTLPHIDALRLSEVGGAGDYNEVVSVSSVG